MYFVSYLHDISFVGCIQKRRNRGKLAFPRLPGLDNDALRRRQAVVVGVSLDIGVRLENGKYPTLSLFVDLA
ncbi:hypothetical protein DB196_21905 [Salmonella enterica]|nr:hypothetical protein [Salmonella enterica]